MSTVPFSKNSDICTTGAVAYNGYKFPSMSDIKIEVTPVFNENGHALIGRKILVRVVTTAIFEPGGSGPLSNFDGQLDDFRSVLEEPGAKLSIYDKSVGDWVSYGSKATSANPDNYPHDMTAGPHPRLVSIEPIVQNSCARIVWECESTININSIQAMEDLWEENNLIEHHSSRSYRFGEDGQIEINTRGTFKTAKYPGKEAINSFHLLDEKMSAMRHVKAAFYKYREAITTEQFEHGPWGYTRSVTFNEDEMNTAIHYTVTDSEIPSDNAFMPYTVNMQVDHTVSSSLLEEDPVLGAGFSTWTNSLSGSITLMAGTPRKFAWAAFISVYDSRIEFILAAQTSVLGRRLNFVVTRIELQEAIYGRTFSFQIDYIVTSDLKSLLGVTKLFTPVDAYFDDNTGDPLPIEDQWREWHESIRRLRLPTDDSTKDDGTLQGPAFGARGITASDYLLTDTLNIPHETEVEKRTPSVSYILPDAIPANAITYKKGSETGFDLYADEDEETGEYGSEDRFDKTWVRYDNEFQTIRDVPTIAYTRTADRPVSIFKDPPVPTDDQIANHVGGSYIGGVNSPGNDPMIGNRTKTVIATGEDTFYIRMRGRAVRAFHEIPQPIVTSVGGVSVIPAGRQIFNHRRVGGNTEQPVYEASWDLTYVVDGSALGANLAIQDTSGKPEVLG